MQLPRLFVKDEAQAAEAAEGAAEAAGGRPGKPVAARVEPEGEKRLPEGASWRWGEPGDEACRMGGTGWFAPNLRVGGCSKSCVLTRGSAPRPRTLHPTDAESFPQPPPLREPLEAALFGKWDQPGNPYLVWRIDATRVIFALTKGVLSRFCCAVMGRYPTTLAVQLKLSPVTLEGLNKTPKLCTAVASKEFVNVLELQEKPPKGLDPEEQWLWVDQVKKSG